MLDDEFRLRLDSAPAPKKVVSQLFEKAKSISSPRLHLAVIDLTRGIHEGRRYLQCEIQRHMIVQQFAEYFSQLLFAMSQEYDPKHENVMRRLQMLAYCQFWECTGTQRLFYQIVRIANSENYEPNLLIDEEIKTNSIYERICALSKKAGLEIHLLLEAIYSNQIRNAFSHSNFWMVTDYVTFWNHNRNNPNSIPSIKYSTWDKLFETTAEFIKELFEARRTAERELKSEIPLKIKLPEFSKPWVISKDNRGYWSVKPSNASS